MEQDKNNNFKRPLASKAPLGDMRFRRTYSTTQDRWNLKKNTSLSRPRSTVVNLFGRYVVEKHFSSKPKKSLYKRAMSRIHNIFRKGPRRVLNLSLLAVILVVIIGSFITVIHLLDKPNYTLTASANSLLTEPDPTVMKQLSYNKSTNSYYVYKAGINKSTNSSSPSSVGLGSEPGKAYSLKVPLNLKNGITYYDNTSKLSFNLAPEFKTAPGKEIDGRFVYPAEKGIQVVYTAKGNGLQEDVILNKSVGDNLNLSYKLDLPNTLQARQVGKDIGIYSASSALFGNITYGSSKDQQLVAKARLTSPKNNLVFLLAPPTIASRDSSNSKASVTYKLVNNTVEVATNNLANAQYPIDIDPSVVISGANFAQGANPEDDIAITSSQVGEAGLSGGALSAGWATTTATPRAIGGTSVEAYNGYLYEIGGNDSTADENVEYAPINSNGTIGSWTATSSLLQGTYWANSASYNGYLYLLGGCGPVYCFTAEVEYALVCNGTNAGIDGCSSTPGSVGTWTATTSLTTATALGAVVAYNNYIYEMSVGETTTVDYAPINANGTIGTWTATSSMIQGTGQASAEVYNGYVYVVGGTLTTSTAITTVEYAPVNPNGTLGTWGTTTSLPVATDAAGGGVSNGYIYEIAGSPNFYTPTNAVWYAPINANGTIGTWVATSNLPTTTFETNSAIYNGYVYTMPGCYTANCNNSDATVYYAPIDPPGTTSTDSYTEGSTNNGTTYSSGFLQSRNFQASVAYNGYLYILGGASGASAKDCTLTGDICNGVQYAPLNSNGTVGTWDYTSAGANNGTTFSAGFTQARYALSAVAYNGYLYVIGGISGASGNDCTATLFYCNGVQYAAINSNGTVGSWSYTTSFTQARDNAGAVVYNGYMYLVGGASGASGNDCTLLSTYYYCSGVQYAAINSNGTTGTWDYTSASANNGTTYSAGFTQARSGAITSVYNGYLYIAGGSSGSSANDCANTGDYCNGVQYAAINSNGTVGTWTSTTSFTQARGYASGFIDNGYMYVMGGNSGTSANDCTNAGDYCNGVQYAAINSNGTLGSWAYTNSFTQARRGLNAVAYNGYMYVIGGNSGTSANDCTATLTTCSGVQYAVINNGGAGTLASWASTTSLGSGIQASASVATNGFLYEIGGENTSASPVNVVDYSPIGNGTVGTWTATTNLPASTDNLSALVYNGYMYVFGGCLSSTCSSSTTGSNYYAVICTGYNSGTGGCSSTPGTVGTWTSTTALPAATNQESAFAYNGYVYIMNGNTLVSGTYTTGVATVDYAGINSNGSIGSWTATASTPAAIDNQSAVEYDGYVYEVGGANSSSTRTANVEFAPINSNGTIGSWTATTSLPVPVGEAGLAAYDGYLYSVGGNSTAGALAATYYAPITNDGTIGSWTATANLPANANYATTVAYNGNVYEIGGSTTNGGTSDTTVDYAGLQSIPRVGHYSIELDTTGISNTDVTPTDLVIYGTNTGNLDMNQTAGVGFGGLDSSIADADDTCTTFNTAYTGNLILQNFQPDAVSYNGCSATTNQARYVWVRLTLDDSQTASYPDINGNQTTITGIYLYYHAATSLRMRGGATFSGGQLQPLDTQP